MCLGIAREQGIENRNYKRTRMRPLRPIFEQAKQAKETLIQDRAKGEELFRELVEGTRGMDGMVYYQRGLAYEAMEELELALADYHKALRFIINTKNVDWRQKVRDAIARVEHQLRDSFQLSLPTIPEPSIAKIFKEAMDSRLEAREALAACRSVLEGVVDYAIKTSKLPVPSRTDLSEKIRMLKDSGLVSTTLKSHMDTIRVLGNSAVHREPVSPGDAEVSRKALEAVVRGIFSQSGS
jgi:hypothetical protein